ncbi:hypothetical protein [Corynebacterium sp. J010B-136]|uniref:hypothetical protein n=1 Tax=Corynebacterium sp. J010B-136 TaxID=2099401 RepID=UPI000CF8E73D|nr:hypothetical protein [Corynebacterium sp. J010B-136]PQM75279.1 hypothetical protein C5Y44_00410 [Corynebacterium sp. J010B-136]
MRSIRKSLIAASTAAVVALSATPAFAQSSNDENQKKDTSLSSNFSLSSEIGDKLEATDSQRDVWGIEKNSSEATKFDQLNYAYVIASAVALIGGGAAFASQVPEVREIAEQFNIELPRFF